MKEQFLTLVGWLVVVAVTVLMVQWLSASPGIVQPVNFNHKIHVEEVGLDCLGCHSGAEDSVSAGIPGIEDCMGCHSAGVSEAPEALKVVGFGERGEEIPWVRVTKLPPDEYNPFLRPYASKVNFTHRRHVGVGGIECAACHGDVGSREDALVKPLKPIRMGLCLSCHRKERVTTDCLACHR